MATAAVSGVVSAAAALGAGELVVGVVGTDDPSLVAAVGAEFIDTFAASLKEVAVSLFGTNDKVALVVGIVIVSLALGAVLGVAARRRSWVGGAGFALFGFVGVAAYRADPLASMATGVVAATAAAVSGAVSLRWLLDRAADIPTTRIPLDCEPVLDTPATSVTDGVRSATGVDAAPASTMELRHMARRAFLSAAATVTAGAGLVAVLGRRLAAGGSSESARAGVELPEASSISSQTVSDTLESTGVSPYITPNTDFYRIDTALSVPQVGLDSWRLKIGGMVDHPVELTFDELLAMDSVEETVTIACVSNQVGGDLIGNARWQGVPLRTLLDRAGVHDDATQLVGRSLDGWTAGFPTELVDGERPVLVAYGMNGEPLPVRHGFPARLIVAGLYGYVSATKWLSEIELTTWETFDGYWVPRGWSKRGPIKTQSRIDVPRAGADLAAGPVPVAGVAWAPGRGITTVEVQIDDGDWHPCDLGDVASDNTWVQWLYRWDASPGDHVITVRATDGYGTTQTSEVASPAPSGATGRHARRVSVT